MKKELTTFPITLIPGKIQEAKKSFVPVKVHPVRPQEPVMGKFQYVGEISLAVVIIAIFIYKFADLESITWVTASITVLLVTAAAFAIYEIITNRLKKAQNLRKQESFECQLRQYLDDVAECGNIKSKNDDPQILEDYRLNQVRKVLLYTNISLKPISWQGPKYFECFYGMLINNFPGKVLINYGLEDEKTGEKYNPNYVVAISDWKLYLDIEIDSPYSLDNRQPKTYLTKHQNDENPEFTSDKHNDYFTNQGWIVIRFAEEQIVKTPKSCCKVIAKVINDIIKDDTFLKNYDGIEDLQPIEIWDEEKCKTLEAEKYRESYLPPKPEDKTEDEFLEYRNFRNITDNQEEKEEIAAEKFYQNYSEETKKEDFAQQESDNQDLSIVKENEEVSEPENSETSENNDTIINSESNESTEPENIEEVTETENVTENNEVVTEPENIEEVTETENVTVNNEIVTEPENIEEETKTENVTENNPAVTEPENIEEVTETENVTENNEIVTEPENIDEVTETENVTENNQEDVENIEDVTLTGDVVEEDEDVTKSKDIENINEKDTITEGITENQNITSLNEEQQNELLAQQFAAALETTVEVTDNKEVTTETKPETTANSEQIKVEMVTTEPIQTKETQQVTAENQSNESKIVYSTQEANEKKALVDLVGEMTEYHKLEKWNDLLECCNKIIEIDPRFELAYMRRSTANGNLGKFEEVIADSKMVNEINPSNADAYYNAGIANLILQRHRNAIEEFNKAIKFGISNPGDVFLTIANIYNKLSDDINYREFLQKAANCDNGKAKILISKLKQDEKYNSLSEFNGCISKHLEIAREGVNEIAFSVNDDYAAIADQSRNLNIYRTSDWEIAYKDEIEVAAMAFSRNNRLMAIGGHGLLRILNTANSTFSLHADITNFTGSIKKIFFHPFNSDILYVSDNFSLWKVDTKTKVINKAISDFQLMAVSKDMQYIAGKDYFNRIKVYRIDVLAETFDKKIDETVEIKSMSINSDGSRLVFGDNNGKIELYNPFTTEQIISETLDSEIEEIEVSNTNYFLVMTTDRKLRFFNTTNGAKGNELQLNFMPKRIKLSNLNNLLAIGNFNEDFEVLYVNEKLTEVK